MIYIHPGAVYDTDMPTVIYDNLFTQGTLSGTAETGFPLGNAVSGATWDYWRTPSTAAASIEAVLSSQSSADCLFIDAHNMATVGAEFRLRVSTDGGATFPTTIIDWTAPDDNSPIMVLFPTATGDVWQLSQRNGPASIGVVMLGEKLAFEYGIEDPVSFRHGERIEIMGGDTLGGQFVGQQIRRKGGNTSFNFPWLTRDWVNNQMAEFEAHYNEGLPFGFALRPSYDADELAYCWRPQGGQELRPQYQQMGKAMSMNMQVSYYVA